MWKKGNLKKMSVATFNFLKKNDACVCVPPNIVDKHTHTLKAFKKCDKGVLCVKLCVLLTGLLLNRFLCLCLMYEMIKICVIFLFKEKERDDEELSLKCEMCVWFGKWRYFL